VLLEVSETNAGARAFYAAHGAVELDRRRRYYRDGSDALVLQLPLDTEEPDRG
jgi:ribosomal-protein-alanine N-acetyltransferase